MSKILDDLKACSGCYACQTICPRYCITMQSDEEGFWYPKINSERCIDCGLCRKICPVLRDKKAEASPIAYAAYNKREEIRMASSSGGLFSLLAEYVIQRDGVGFGACFDERFHVVHQYTERKEELEKFRGSKYVQSKIGESYQKVKEFLMDGRMVLFTGTPCQIGGLKAYLQKEYENLICQDMICHGVPSPKVWDRYLKYRETIAGSAAQKITFRGKKNGWKRFSLSFSFKNDSEYDETLDRDFMMTAFLKNVCLRPSCYNCSFKNIRRESDITLADFWGIQNIFPGMDDDKGTSLLILNSLKGKALFEKVKNGMEYRSVALQEAIKYNPAMTQSVLWNSKRNGFLKNIDKIAFDKLVKRYCSGSLLSKCRKKAYAILSKGKSCICVLIGGKRR